jgi:hypothetical protein
LNIFRSIKDLLSYCRFSSQFENLNICAALLDILLVDWVLDIDGEAFHQQSWKRIEKKIVLD